jgi:hypothetical protein
MKNIGITILGLALLTGCTSYPSAKAVRVLDENDTPIENAEIRLTYAVQYTVPIWTTGPTDRNGYAKLRSSYEIRPSSHASIITKDEITGFNYERLGLVRDGVLTLSTWRGYKTKTLKGDGSDSLSVSGIYLSKEKK